MAERSDELCLFDLGACYAALLQQFAKCFYVSICGELRVNVRQKFSFTQFTSTSVDVQSA